MDYLKDLTRENISAILEKCYNVNENFVFQYYPETENAVSRIEIETELNHYNVTLRNFRISTLSDDIRDNNSQRSEYYHNMMYQLCGECYLDDLFAITNHLKGVQENYNKAKKELDDTFAKIEKDKQAFISAYNSKEFTIRKLTGDDRPAVFEMDRHSGFDVGYFLEDLKMSEESDYAFGIFSEGVLIGYCSLGGADEYSSYPEWSKQDLCLCDVYIDPLYRHKGAGTQLVNFAIQSSPYGNVFITLMDEGLCNFYKPLDFTFEYEKDFTWNGVMRLHRQVSIFFDVLSFIRIKNDDKTFPEITIFEIVGRFAHQKGNTIVCLNYPILLHSILLPLFG